MSKDKAFELFEKERDPYREYMIAKEQFEQQEHERASSGNIGTHTAI